MKKQRNRNLDRLLTPDRRYVGYQEGANYFKVPYHTFAKAVRKAGIGIRRDRTIIVNLQEMKAYVQSNSEVRAWFRKISETGGRYVK